MICANGQIASRLQGTIPSHVMVNAIAGLFAIIGLAMGWIVIGAFLLGG